MTAAPDLFHTKKAARRTALTQGPDALLRRYPGPYTYDLTDPEFQAYCTLRGILYHAGRPGSRRWEYCRDHHLTEADYLADNHIDLTHAQEWQGKRHQYTHEHRRKLFDTVQISRAKLQDCWELSHQK